jgi:transposase-like protein
MLDITIEVESPQAHLKKPAGKKDKRSLKQYLLEKMQIWINGMLEAERDEFLGRDRYAQLDEQHDNYRNGYRRRVLNFFGLGKIELKVPRDRKGEFESAWLPERTAQDPET